MKKATKINLALLALTLSANGLYAQQGFGTNQPSKAAVIDLQSESKGLLIPRVTLTSLTDFLPVKGETATNIEKTNSLLVYNTATVGTTIKPGYYYWTTDGTTPNSSWKRLLANDDSSALALTGDVTGTLGTTVVGKIQGTSVASTAPTNNQVLTYNGTAWTPTAISPATITGKGTLTTQGGIEFTGSTNGTDKLLGDATIQIADLGVTTSKLGNDAVTNTKLADNAVQTENIANRNVTAEKLTAGTGTAGRVAMAGANGVVTYTNAVPGSSIAGGNVTAASTKVTLAGTPAGAALKAFSIDVNEANLSLNNIGGTLNANKITPGTSGQVLTTNGSSATVWADKSSLITSVSNTSTDNSLTTTVNGTTGSAVSIINSNGLTLNSSNQLVSTVNGIASTGLDLGPAVTAVTTHTLGVSGNTLTSTVNGIAPTASILNNFSNTLSGSTLSTNANGLTASIDLSPAIKTGETLTSISQDGVTGVITYSRENATNQTANVRSEATGNLITYNGGAFLNAAAVQDIQKTTTVVAGTNTAVTPNPATPNATGNTAYTVNVATATTSTRGVVSAGSGLSITSGGVLSVNTASTGIGKTLTGSGITVTAGSTVGTGTSLANTVLADVTLGIADSAVNSAKIANGSIQGEDLNANVAGNGLTQAAGGALQVNTYNGIKVNTTGTYNDHVGLGGALNEATTITATATNTLAIAGLQTGVVADNIMVVNPATNVVKKVKAVMPKFFYMPSIVFDISVVGTFNRNLYNEYINQFGTPMVSSSGSTEGIPTLLASQLEYYITYYDTNIFENLVIDQNGVLTYRVKNSNASEKTFMNIVFVVKNN